MHSKQAAPHLHANVDGHVHSIAEGQGVVELLAEGGGQVIHYQDVCVHEDHV